MAIIEAVDTQHTHTPVAVSYTRAVLVPDEFAGKNRKKKRPLTKTVDAR